MRLGIEPLGQKPGYARYSDFVWGVACHELYQEHLDFRRTRYHRFDTFYRRLHGPNWVSNSRYASLMRLNVKARGE